VSKSARDPWIARFAVVPKKISLLTLYPQVAFDERGYGARV
jgi:hypothetical protein